VACGKVDGVVGTMHAAVAGAPSVSTAAGAGPTLFETEFVDNRSIWEVSLNLPGASADFGRSDSSARDGLTAELRFPGDPERVGGVGTDYVTQIETLAQFSFGRLSTRVRFDRCEPDEEVIQSILGYFSDGSDDNQNGITDDIEIDLQVPCSSPTTLYLTVFTDYESTPAGDRFRKSSHIIDFATGTEYESAAVDSDAFARTGTRAALVQPSLFDSRVYYELGFEWRADALRFFLINGATELTLYSIKDATRIPKHPVALMYNLWHPESHWFPATGPANYPARDVTMRIDWLQYQSFEAP
jgi:hypothetical protein